MAEHFNRTRKILQMATDANTRAFLSTSREFNKKQNESKIIIGDLVFVKTTRRGKMHHKLANTYKGPYMCTDILDNDNLLFTPINGIKPIRMHKNNCKKRLIRPNHLLLTDTSQKQPSPTSHDTHIFDYSDQLSQSNMDIIILEEDDILPQTNPDIEENYEPQPQPTQPTDDNDPDPPPDLSPPTEDYRSCCNWP